MAGKLLHDLDVDAAAHESRNVGVAQRMEVGHALSRGVRDSRSIQVGP
ncbi:MAG TPA: hypothetical protein PLE19_12115 [Planctomycetota bacterium]|nr:hypothetical protein [Planctomycetota bacterium]HRR80522.1 hypothetical protein [Planctomycetota bacterium]